MWPLRRQIASAVGFCDRLVAPIIGAERVETDLDDPNGAIDNVRESLGRATGGTIGRVNHMAGEANLDQEITDYLVSFAIPNLWFHLSMAYAILRARNVAIGKADFDGRHRYG